MQLKNGDSYEGPFQSDQFETGGKQCGIYIWGKGSQMAGDRYLGPFKANKMHGKGQYYIAAKQKNIEIQYDMGKEIEPIKQE